MSLRVDSPVPPALGFQQLFSRRSSARRRLSFVESHEPLSRDINEWLDEELNRINRECKKRWNFDFPNNLPCDGSLKWKALTEENVPEAYRPTDLASPPKTLTKLLVDKDTSLHDSSCNRVIPNTGSCAELPNNVKVKIEKTPPTSGKVESPDESSKCNSLKVLKRNKEITDYFPAKKQRL